FDTLSSELLNFRSGQPPTNRQIEQSPNRTIPLVPGAGPNAVADGLLGLAAGERAARIVAAEVVDHAPGIAKALHGHQLDELFGADGVALGPGTTVHGAGLGTGLLPAAAGGGSRSGFAVWIAGHWSLPLERRPLLCWSHGRVLRPGASDRGARPMASPASGGFCCAPAGTAGLCRVAAVSGLRR